MSIRAVLKRWGNSYGVVIPKDVAAKQGIKENDEVEVTITRAGDMRSLFGRYRFDDVRGES